MGLFLPISETVAKTGMILLAGEVTSHATVDYQKVVRETIRQIGYDDSRKGVYTCVRLYRDIFSFAMSENGDLSCFFS